MTGHEFAYYFALLAVACISAVLALEARRLRRMRLLYEAQLAAMKITADEMDRERAVCHALVCELAAKMVRDDDERPKPRVTVH